jgi:hypothetical protein
MCRRNVTSYLGINVQYQVVDSYIHHYSYFKERYQLVMVTVNE